MAFITIQTLVEAQIGGEIKRISRRATLSSGDQCYDNTINLFDGAVSTSQATLFDASVQTQFAAFTMGIIIVDPDDDYEDGDDEPVVAIDFVGDGVSTPAIEIRREAPFIFGTSNAGGGAGAGLATIDGAITQIRARNNNADPGTPLDADVNVRIILFN